MLGFKRAAVVFSFLAGMASAEALPSGFVYLRKIAPQIVQDIRYAGFYNFTNAPVPGYVAAECVLSREAAEALLVVETALAAEGFGLIVWDCYRPLRAVHHFSAWAKDPKSPDLGQVFFPDLQKRDLHHLGYISNHSSHARGSTVDVGLLSKATRPPAPDPEDLRRCDGDFSKRPRETDVDMGTNFDCFSSQSGELATIAMQARTNRQRLKAAMEAAGFQGYHKEWWHFRLRDAPFDGRNFDFVIPPMDQKSTEETE